MTFRPRSLAVWGALFALVAVGCATGIIGDAGDGGYTTDASPVEAGTDSGAVDSGTVDTGRPDAGNPDTGMCADWAGPTATASCTDNCNATTHICGPNGCYNMWWCKISTGVCSANPATGCN